MDIGTQKRVIIVEKERLVPPQGTAPKDGTTRRKSTRANADQGREAPDER
jgi:hypothetical protein